MHPGAVNSGNLGRAVSDPPAENALVLQPTSVCKQRAGRRPPFLNTALQRAITSLEMEKEKTTEETIELRSEKVRKLIGDIPPSLVRWGIAIIAIVAAALIAAACLLPYPYSDGESILRHFF